MLDMWRNIAKDMVSLGFLENSATGEGKWLWRTRLPGPIWSGASPVFATWKARESFKQHRFTLPKTHIATENRPSQKENNLPTIPIFRCYIIVSGEVIWIIASHVRFRSFAACLVAFSYSTCKEAITRKSYSPPVVMFFYINFYPESPWLVTIFLVRLVKTSFTMILVGVVSSSKRNYHIFHGGWLPGFIFPIRILTRPSIQCLFWGLNCRGRSRGSKLTLGKTWKVHDVQVCAQQKTTELNKKQRFLRNQQPY